MARTHRVTTTVALLVCLLGGPWGGILFAADEPFSQAVRPPGAHYRFAFTDEILAVDRPAAAAHAQAWQGNFNFVPADSTLLAQRGSGGTAAAGTTADRPAIIIGAAADRGRAILVAFPAIAAPRRTVAATAPGRRRRVLAGARRRHRRRRHMAIAATTAGARASARACTAEGARTPHEGGAQKPLSSTASVTDLPSASSRMSRAGGKLAPHAEAHAGFVAGAVQRAAQRHAVRELVDAFALVQWLHRHAVGQGQRVHRWAR